MTPEQISEIICNEQIRVSNKLDDLSRELAEHLRHAGTIPLWYRSYDALHMMKQLIDSWLPADYVHSWIANASGEQQ
ncbi:hypothetical protein [Caballeronia zhejiangensis]|uniref:hypothetical protein n=1 Tax=Caballeronia zhejiangensis TaxID=871203 RepID=UPI001F519AEF|nr:hypothetical protein [Caballeronia zhejiangensis]MCI1046940.1 hypothetical protein [Caballeronia zhejiangensis]